MVSFISPLTNKILDILAEVDESEPDTKAEVNLDDIAGTDKSQQIRLPQQRPMQQQQNPQPQNEPAAPPNLDNDQPKLSPDEMVKDDNIISSLKGHPYMKLYASDKSGALDPMKIADMDKTALVGLKAKVDDLLTQQELRKKIGLYKDNKYKIMINLQNFIDSILQLK